MSETTEKVEETKQNQTLENTSLSESPAVEPITKKDPKKVEQGKRLAAISKAAKEKKMRERIESEINEKKSKEKIKIPTTLLVGLPLVAGYLIYKWYFSGDSKTKVETEMEPEEPIEKKKVKSEKKFETLG